MRKTGFKEIQDVQITSQVIVFYKTKTGGIQLIKCDLERQNIFGQNKGLQR